jgi:hypothetical protein
MKMKNQLIVARSSLSKENLVIEADNPCLKGPSLGVLYPSTTSAITEVKLLMNGARKIT